MCQTRPCAAIALVLALAAACTSLPAGRTSGPLATSAPSAATTSTFPFEETSARLEAAVAARGLTLFSMIDHSAGAEAAGLALPPSRLFIFGNPQGGTPLMLANPALGLDLPLKALVYEKDGEVNVLVIDIRAVTEAAGVSEPEALIARMEGTLAAIATEATGAD